MSKIPPKPGISSPTPCSVGGNAPQTRATTAALAAKSTVEQPTAMDTNSGEDVVMANSPPEAQPRGTDVPQPSAFQRIAEMLAAIIQSGKLDTLTKQNVTRVIKIAKEAEAKEKTRVISSGQEAKVSDIRMAVWGDLVKLHNSLEKKIHKVQEENKVILDSTSKVLVSVEEAKTDTKDLASKVSKVTDTMDKIASDMNSYQSALLSKPAQPNKTATDPKVLSDMECKARQILMDIYDKDEDNILSKSLTDIIEKANDTIAGLKCASKPKDIKVIMALKTHGKVVLLTLNSKEAASWIRELLNKVEFSSGFSAESHIRARTFNLIVPRIPVIFDPSKEKHICEVKETNCLDTNMIRKAKWIKPMGRRRPGQTNTYAIFTLTSVDSANTLIRDRLYICSIKVRPTKQKQEPIQCMKCREWGHFTSECQSEKDVCGNCGGEHRTNTCQNKDKLYCVACGKNMHASWSRNCPEFNRQCLIYDGRNPENAMLFFPMEHNWTLTVRPDSILLVDRFPARFSVNVLPMLGRWQQVPRSCQQNRGQRYSTKDRNGCENPNRIQIPPSCKREEGELPVSDTGRGPDASSGGINMDWTTPCNMSGWN